MWNAISIFLACVLQNDRDMTSSRQLFNSELEGISRIQVLVQAAILDLINLGQALCFAQSALHAIQ